MEQAPQTFYSLPYDVLVLIFEQLDLQSLGRLRRTCKKFREIISSEDSIWRQSSLNCFGSNMSSKVMEMRCKPILKYKDRCKISKSWYRQLGDITNVDMYKKCMPCIVLQKDYLYFSKGRAIIRHARAQNGNVILTPFMTKVPCEDDISEFAVNEIEVVCGGRDGRIARLDKCSLDIVHSFMGHKKDILAVDTKKDVIVSGSKDYSLKIWKFYTDPQIDTEFKREIMIGNKILSTSIMLCNTKFVVGTPGTKDTHPLQLYDLESGSHFANLGKTPYGAGILDIAPESYNTLYSAGYDTTLRLYDIRSPVDSVATWTEPFDSAMYCVQTDHNVTMITGSSHSGCFMIWDKRVQRQPVKIYHIPFIDRNNLRVQRLSAPTFFKGPVYDVDFDAAHIYCGFEKAVLQFSYMRSTDYP